MFKRGQGPFDRGPFAIGKAEPVGDGTRKVSNRVSRDVLAVNPDLRTIKADKQSHGLGLKIIQKTLDEHEGMLGTEVKDGWFVASFMLPVTG